VRETHGDARFVGKERLHVLVLDHLRTQNLQDDELCFLSAHPALNGQINPCRAAGADLQESVVTTDAPRQRLVPGSSRFSSHVDKALGDRWNVRACPPVAP
jgi:hypothetical protein